MQEDVILTQEHIEKKFKQMAAWWDVIYVFIGFGVCALFSHMLFNRI